MNASVSALFADLQRKYGVQPDRRGECAIRCVACGKEPKAGQTHASFSERGFFCFVCSTALSLPALARRLEVPVTTTYVAPPPVPREPARWHSEAERLLARFCQAPDRATAWKAYKPALDLGTIARHQFGLGVLPSTACSHQRLIVPLRELDGALVGFRGRRIHCPPWCERAAAKWLSAGGSVTPLWNAASLHEGARVVITESPVSAALQMQVDPTVTAVATLSAGTWRPEWTEWLVGVRWALIVMDNDQAGWKASLKIAGALAARRVTHRIHHWPEGTARKWDLADEVNRLIEDRCAA